MADFKTLNGATELFESVGGLRNNNNIFVVFKNNNKEAMKYGLAGGLIAAGLPAVITSDKAQGILGNKFDGLLINQTEEGLAIIPLHVKGVQMMLNIEKMQPDLDGYCFFTNDVISGITVKNFNIFNKKMQSVKVEIAGKYHLELLGKVAEKSVPYQEANFGKFMSKYKAK